MKSCVYRNAAVTACFLGLLGLLVGCFEMSVSFEAANPDTSSPLSTDVDLPEVHHDVVSTVSPSNSNSTAISQPVSTPSNKSEQNTNSTVSVLASRQSLTSSNKSQGNLRMSNQTDQPVRLALLVRQSGNKSSVKAQADIPAHWDFDPQEGSAQGLILSLPNGNLKIEKGDILVAFAQDGSRRYWGPYVVGETSLPKWNAQQQEWLLVLTP
ncbi:hypothetical protein [Anabaena sp. 4-3]|uniref:hypothetical protein n=1 Tax=Anabaena sp. 4-3 TaxID=1811979 RepID=UPI000829B058|nr:hypothetical protein [Anabaena sp. 4-3]